MQITASVIFICWQKIFLLLLVFLFLVYLVFIHFNLANQVKKLYFISVKVYFNSGAQISFYTKTNKMVYPKPFVFVFLVEF